MDTIAGKEQVRTLTEQAEIAAAGIKNDHERAASAYASFTQLEQQATRLKELRKGLKELTDSNLIELRNHTKLRQNIGKRSERRMIAR